MSDFECTDDDVTEPTPVGEVSREALVVIDFTVGPAGVGPATGITPIDVSQIRSEESLAE